MAYKETIYLLLLLSLYTSSPKPFHPSEVGKHFSGGVKLPKCNPKGDKIGAGSHTVVTQRVEVLWPHPMPAVLLYPQGYVFFHTLFNLLFASSKYSKFTE